MSRRRLLIGAAALAVVALGALGAYLLQKERASRDVRGSSTEEFVATEPAPQPPPPAPEPGEAELAGIVWPTFGYDNARLRRPPFALRPPFRRLWTFRARQLVEFPPAVAYGRLYFTNNSGVMFAVNAATGKRAWRKTIGRCVASEPAVASHTVFQAFLNRPPCNSDVPPGRLEGEVIAFASGFGRIRWRTRIGPTESSPLVANGRVYVGDWRGRVYALDERTGGVRWTFQGRGRIKGAVALSGNRLYVGTYSGRLYALDATTGRRIWEGRSQDRLGGRGQFYSTPAAAYGRVYIGSTDGKLYSFGATSGEIRWSQDTGGFVYSSPAVWERRVFAGSYSGRFFAFDAATGDELWSFRANGRIIGSPTVIAGVVYFATLSDRTYALDARTGRELWAFPDGQYTPVVADSERLYLVGHTRLYGMAPRTRPSARASARRLSAREVASALRATGYGPLHAADVAGRSLGRPIRWRLPVEPQLDVLLVGRQGGRYGVAVQVVGAGERALPATRMPVRRVDRTTARACNLVLTAERPSPAFRRLVERLRRACDG